MSTTAVDTPVTTHGRRAVERPPLDPRRLVVVVVAAVVVTVTAFLITLLQPVKYSSSRTFVLQSSASASQTETLVRNMLSLIPDETVAGDLKRITQDPRSAEEIASHLTVSRPPGASVVVVAYEDTDRERSRTVAAALGLVVNTLVGQLGTQTPSAPTFAMAQWGQDQVATRRLAPPVLRNTLVGLLAGSAVGLTASVFVRRRREPSA